MLTRHTLQTIKEFKVTGANYQPAVDCLKHMYGRKRVIVSPLVKSVIKMDAKCIFNPRSLWYTKEQNYRFWSSRGKPSEPQMYPVANVRDKIIPSVTGKVGVRACRHPWRWHWFLFVYYRKVVSKKTGERVLYTNTNPNNRSSSNGRNESKKSVKPIQVTVNEYQLLLLCSVWYKHR